VTVKKVQLGADRKKVAFLAVVLAVLSYFLYQNFFSDPLGTGGAAQAPRKTTQLERTVEDASASGAGARPAPGAPAAVKRAPAARATRQEFKPIVKRAEGAADNASVDPTLRLDLLAKLKAVEIGRVERSLFDFSAAPPPKLPEPKIVVAKPAPRMIGPELPPPPPKPVPPAPKPPAPPVPFKFYGMLTPKAGGAKRAFLLDGDEILTPAEGETLKKRYRIVRIGVNSVTLEDLDFQAQQTLTIAEESAG
jgi:hypothetical protein